MHLILLIILAVIFSLFVKKSRSQGILLMPIWLFFAYGFLLINHFFSGIVYYSGNIFRILPYFFSCLFLIFLGHQIGKKFKFQTIDKVLVVELKSIGWVSVLGSLLYSYDLIRMNSIAFGFRIQDYTISMVGVIGNAVSSFSLLVWLYSLYYYKIRQIKIPGIAYLAMLSYVAGGVISAGRQAVIILVISSMILFIWASKKNKENLKGPSGNHVKKYRKPWGLYVFVLLFISYFLFISEVRSGISNISNKIEMFEYIFNAKTSKSTIELANNLGVFEDIYLEFCYYYSHELIRLDLLFQYYEHPPLFGLSQMLYLERRLQWLIGRQGDICWEKQVYALEDKAGFSSHTWSTFVGSFIVDYGRVGTLFGCFFLGLIIGVIYQRFKMTESPKSIIRLCIICTGIVFSIQFSPISELTYFIPLVFCSFLVLKPKQA